jgi:hypothetical protein
MMAKVQITVWDLLAATAKLAGSHAWRALLSVVLVSGSAAASRFAFEGFWRLAVWPVLLLCEYDLTRALLAGSGARIEGGWLRRFWPMAGLCLLSQFGIFAGLSLLVIPGILLAVRWMLAGPIQLAEERGIIDALKVSWAETSANAWLLLQALAILYGPFIAAALIVFSFADSEAPAIHVILDLLARAGMVGSWICAVAAYRLSGRQPAALGKLFS